MSLTLLRGWMVSNHIYVLICFQAARGGALINGLEARVNVIEEKMSDIDARTSEEADNALNERELDRFIMSGNCFVMDSNII